ncbi:MAG: hypothetical protein DMG30_01610 [Acidobacteria bacterium]|nr:MAG: hypothetical protein DMG30_01610 [Acidobacteriota bacterium]
MAIGITRTFRLCRTVRCATISLSAIVAVGYFQDPRLVSASPPAPQAQGTEVTPVQTAAGAAPAVAQVPGALVKQYCIVCHNQNLKTAGLMLDQMDISHLGAAADVWEKVVQKVRSGAMPPAGMPRPDKATFEAFLAHLESELDSEAVAHPNAGRPSEHRLNRFEYSNAVRDLLGLDIDAESLLPADESDHGFDNIAEVLAISPTLLERYMLAARKISRLAIGDPATSPAVETFKISRGLRQDDRMSDDLPIGTRGGTLIHYYFPLDGEYVVAVRLGRNFTSAVIRGINTRDQVDVLLDGARVARFTIGGECGSAPRESLYAPKDPKCRDYVTDADAALHVRFPVTSGMHALGVAFVKKSMVTEGSGPALLPPRHTSSTYDAPRMDIDSVRLEGPYNATGPGDTPSRRRILVCHPSGAADEEPCAKKILAMLARRAYRRPVTDGDIEKLLQFYRAARGEGSFESGLQEALARLLVSPQFLFRVERDPTNIQAGAVYRISDLELASRLSFFLWSSIPDDQLLDIAERGKLKDPEILEQQARRMLADPRATAALAENFGGQWLRLRNMKVVDPDPRIFPEFDDNLREDFLRETELFLESQIREDRPLEELLTANYTFVNERLARFYGIPNVYGTHFRRALLVDPYRAGLLGQGSVLTVTSYATRTSPVLRGKFLLEAVLGAPPPPPPPNVPPLKEVGDGGHPPASMRERMEEHRKNAVCATCHTRMDPLGFALENFNAIGKFRTADGNSSIDASGVLPDGTKFSNPNEFRQALLKHRDEFVTTFTVNLMTYALGRAVQYYDMPAIRTIIRDAAPNDYPWSSLILGIIKSRPFQMRNAQEPARNSELARANQQH